MRPVDPVTLEEAAVILGCSISSVRRRVAEGRLPRRRKRYKHLALSRADVEALATEVYVWRQHIDDPDSYWVTSSDAAVILGVNRPRVQQLSVAGRLPFAVHRDGTRLYRRRQLEVVANARMLRWPYATGTAADQASAIFRVWQRASTKRS